MTPSETLAKHTAAAKRESLELAMLAQLRALRLDDGMVQQYRPDALRVYRADFAWPHARLLLEVNGGTWNGGKHGRGSGIERDYEKWAIAAIDGFRTICASASQVRSGVAAQWVALALGLDA